MEFIVGPELSGEGEPEAAAPPSLPANATSLILLVFLETSAIDELYADWLADSNNLSCDLDDGSVQRRAAVLWGTATNNTGLFAFVWSKADLDALTIASAATIFSASRSGLGAAYLWVTVTDGDIGATPVRAHVGYANNGADTAVFAVQSTDPGGDDAVLGDAILMGGVHGSKNRDFEAVGGDLSTLLGDVKYPAALPATSAGWGRSGALSAGPWSAELSIDASTGSEGSVLALLVKGADSGILQIFSIGVDNIVEPGEAVSYTGANLDTVTLGQTLDRATGVTVSQTLSNVSAGGGDIATFDRGEMGYTLDESGARLQQQHRFILTAPTGSNFLDFDLTPEGDWMPRVYDGGSVLGGILEGVGVQAGAQYAMRSSVTGGTGNEVLTLLDQRGNFQISNTEIGQVLTVSLRAFDASESQWSSFTAQVTVVDDLGSLAIDFPSRQVSLQAGPDGKVRTGP